MAEKRPPLPLMLTAQDLRRGGVVYWDGRGWARRIEDGLVARDAAVAEALEAERDAARAGDDVIDVFLFALAEDSRTPAHFRERARVIGPSFRDDFGRNSEGVSHVSL